MSIMQICILVCLLTHATTIWIQEGFQSRWELNGRVVSESGKLLSGVLLEPYKVITDENGRYKIDLPSFPGNGFTIQFRCPGYRTTTKAIISSSTHQLDVVMRSGNNTWVPQLCDPSSDSSRRVGWHMKFLVPKGTKIERSSDTDTETIRLLFMSNNKGFEWMILGTGPLWGGGYAPAHLLISPEDIQEREILAGGKRGIDLRVLEKNGTIWRRTGFFTESLSYSNVSPTSATGGV
jgi:hypothetical protein